MLFGKKVPWVQSPSSMTIQNTVEPSCNHRRPGCHKVRSERPARADTQTGPTPTPPLCPPPARQGCGCLAAGALRFYFGKGDAACPSQEHQYEDFTAAPAQGTRDVRERRGELPLQHNQTGQRRGGRGLGSTRSPASSLTRSDWWSLPPGFLDS